MFIDLKYTRDVEEGDVCGERWSRHQCSIDVKSCVLVSTDDDLFLMSHLFLCVCTQIVVVWIIFNVTLFCVCFCFCSERLKYKYSECDNCNMLDFRIQ